MLGLKFSKLPKHRRYNYTPTTYSDNEEDLKGRIKEIKREMGEVDSDEELVKENIRKVYATKTFENRYISFPTQRFYGLRILLIAGIIGFVFVKVLNSNFIELFFGYFNK